MKAGSEGLGLEKDRMTERNRQRIAALAAVLALAGACAAQTARSAPASQPAPAVPVAASQPVEVALSSVENKPLSASRPMQDAENRLLKSAARKDPGEWIQTGLAFALVVGLIFAARWLLKKTGRPAPGSAGGAMEILARTRVSSRQQLLLVRVGRRLVLMGEGPSGMTALSEFSGEEADELLLSLPGGRGKAVEELLRRTGSHEKVEKVLSRPEQGESR